MNDPNLARFRDFLIVEFNEEQLAGLCQDVGLTYVDLPGTGAYGKTRELIEIARSRHLLNALMTRTHDLRPDAYKSASIKDIEPDGPSETAPLATPQNGASATGPDGAATDPLPVPVRGTPQEERAALLAALTPRARLLAVLVGVLLLVVAALTIILPKPSTTPAGTPTPNETAVAAAAQMTADAAAQATVAPATVDTTTQAIDSTADVSDTQAAQTTPAADAAAAVRSINDQLIEFYTGKATADDVKTHFNTASYKVVTSFAYTKLKRVIGVDLTKGDSISVTLRYEKDPLQTTSTGSSFTVSSTEYWNYTNPKTNRSYCDTSSYIYTIVKNGDNFQITNLKSSSISSKCSQ